MEPEEQKNLLGFVRRVAGEEVLRVEDDFGQGFVRLRTSEAERRQAKHDIRSVEDCVVELLRNSRDSQCTTIFLAQSSDAEGKRSLVLIDDGRGIPRTMHQRVVEPRVTSRLDDLCEDRWGVHGRGMALYGISVATEKFLLTSDTGLGTSVRLEIDTEKLPEKKDQSTFPKAVQRGGRTELIGVRNIPWIASRFWLDHPSLNIFVGSPAEVVRSMVVSGRKIGVGHLQPANLWLRIALASSTAELGKHVAVTLGEELSPRTLQRILSGETKEAVSVGEHIRKGISGERARATQQSLQRATVTGRFSDQDLEQFAQAVDESFRHLAERYFVTPVGKPKIRRRTGGLDIKIDIAEHDVE